MHKYTGALVVQDPLDPTNNVTAGCFAFGTLQHAFRKAQVRIQNKYFEFRSSSASNLLLNTDSSSSKEEEEVSVLGALFDVPHHNAVVKHTALMWCPPEISTRKRNDNGNRNTNVKKKESTAVIAQPTPNDTNAPLVKKSINNNMENDEMILRLRERNSLLAAENDYLKERLKIDNISSGGGSSKKNNSFSPFV